MPCFRRLVPLTFVPRGQSYLLILYAFMLKMYKWYKEVYCFFSRWLVLYSYESCWPHRINLDVTMQMELMAVALVWRPMFVARTMVSCATW